MTGLGVQPADRELVRDIQHQIDISVDPSDQVGEGVPDAVPQFGYHALRLTHLRLAVNRLLDLDRFQQPP